MPIKSMIRLNQLVTEQADYDISAENSAKTALSTRSDADEALKNIVESLVQRHGIGSASGGFLADNAQGVLAHFTSGVTAPLVIKHEGTDAAAEVQIDSAQNVSIDALVSSNFTVDGAAESLTLSVSGGGAQQLIASSEGTGQNAVRLNASAGGFDVDGVLSSSMNVVAAGNATGAAVLTIGASHSGTDGADTASIDMDAKTQIDIASAGSGANAILLTSSAGGFDFDCAAGYDLEVSDGGLSEVVTAGGAMRRVVAGDIQIEGTSATAAQSINLHLNSDADPDALRFEMDSTFDGNANSEQNSVISLINAVGNGDAAIKLQSELGGIDLDAKTDFSVLAEARLYLQGDVDDTAISADYADPTAPAAAVHAQTASGMVFMSGLDQLLIAGTEGSPAATANAAPADAFTYTQNMATDLGTNNTAGLNHLILSDIFCAGEYAMTDVNTPGSGTPVWEGLGIPLSMASDEWYQFREAFGEVSLLNAITQASSGSTDSFYIEAELLQDISAARANPDIFSDMGNDLDVKDAQGTAVNSAPSMSGTTSQEELESRIEVYVNGQRMAINGDFTPDLSSGSLDLQFTFDLEVGDMIIVKA